MISTKVLYNCKKFIELCFKADRCYWTDHRIIKNHMVNFCVNSKCIFVSKRSIQSPYIVNVDMKMSGHSDVFKLSDYDCIGFDLDNTLCRYNVEATMKMEYQLLAKFLVEKKNYSPKHLLKPVDEDISFIQKGLILDFNNGNVLQISKDGKVIRAHHGTRLLNDEEVVTYYGSEKKWTLAVEFCNDILGAWNGPLSLRLRTLLDSFDMPASLAFARVIDAIDESSRGRLSKYEVWPDVLEGLHDMYRRENFAANTGGYFPAIKAAPEQFISQCNGNLISWLKTIKGHAKTFLVTGSNVDFATFTATHSLGSDWSNYFDMVVCYARKPGFFTSSRVFLALENFREASPVQGKDLNLSEIYSQGNWNELLDFFRQVTRKERPKCLYIGDNLIQDIYIPSKYTNLDTVAVVDNLATECSSSLITQPWLSYFGSGKDCVSIWTDIIYKHSKVCIPDLNLFCEKPIEYPWTTFRPSNQKVGFHPNPPSILF